MADKRIICVLKLQIYELGMYRGEETWHIFADKVQKKLKSLSELRLI